MAEVKKELALQGQAITGIAITTGLCFYHCAVAVAPVLKCHVMLQKEADNGPPIDEECGNVVESSHAGLCL